MSRLFAALLVLAALPAGERGPAPASFFEAVGTIEMLPLHYEAVNEVLLLRAIDLTDHERRTVARAICEEADRAGYDPYLVLGLIDVESDFRRDVVSTADARGLMQIQPVTLGWLIMREQWTHTVEQVQRDPALQVRLGVRYVRYLHDRFGKLDAALMAYNMGPTKYGIVSLEQGALEPYRAYAKAVRRDAAALRAKADAPAGSMAIGATVVNRWLQRMASGADKRKYPRVQARNVSAHLNVTDRSSPCVIQNISAGGVFIETREALPVGMPVAVNLARPGWSSVLKVTGRVVWALAEKTAQRKGTVPGMRIKFDPLGKEIAERLAELLRELGAPVGPPPPTKREKEPGSITQPSSIKSIQERLQATAFPLVKEKTPPEPKVSAPRTRRPITLEKRPDDATIPARVGDLAAVFGQPSDQAPRLIVQVQGLLMQLGELQQTLEQRERELSTLKAELSAKDNALEKSDRERKAAELAIQRLSMQLAARR